MAYLLKVPCHFFSNEKVEQYVQNPKALTEISKMYPAEKEFQRSQNETSANDNTVL